MFLLSSAAGCGSSSDSKSWDNQLVEDSAFMQAVAVGSVYTGGAGRDCLAKIWRFDQGDHEVAVVLGDNLSTVIALKGDGDVLTAGYHDAVSGHVSTYDTLTGLVTDLGLPQAAGVTDLTYWNDALIVSGRDADDQGRLWRYQADEWSEVQDSGMLNTCKVLAVSGEHLYVGGLNATDISQDTAFVTVVKFDGDTWTNLQPSIKIPLVRAMIADGSGGVYVAGDDNSRKGRVWQVTPDGVWTDLDLDDAMEARALALSDSGTLYVGGTNLDNVGEVWKLDASGWGTTGVVKGAWTVTDIGLPESGKIVASGMDVFMHGGVWIYE